MRTIRYVVAVFTSLLALAPTAARAGENFALWNKRMPISFSGYTPPVGGAPLTNFPALVVFSNTTAGAGFDYADFLSPPWGDLRFAAADRVTPLDFEVESWNTEGLSHVWVKVPELTAETVVYALWGMEGAEAPPCTTNGAVWSEGYVAVYHLAEETGAAADSSPLLQSAAKNGGIVQGPAGAVGRCAGWPDGGNDWFQAPHHSSLDGMGKLTLQIWMYDAQNDTQPRGLISKRVSSTTRSYCLFKYTNRALTLYVGNTTCDFGADSITEANRWYFVTVTYDMDLAADRVKLFFDGSLKRALNTVSGAVPATSTDLHIGILNKDYGNCWKGKLDEARISNVARSAGWIWSEYMNMASNDVFNVYGAPEFQDLPAVSNAGGATNVTADSAWLCGTLVSTGASATAVSVYWGTTDGGTNASDWGTGAHWPAPQAPGAFTVQAAGLDADSACFYRFAASNEAGVAWAQSSSAFITGDVWIEKTSDAAELGPVPGTFTVHRAGSATGCDLPVAYAVGGTATPGADYAPLSGTLTIPAGETSATVVVTPVFDRALEEDETVVVTLLPGPYVTGTEKTATMEIGDHRLEVVWDGSGDMTWTQPDATGWSGATYETNGFATFAGAGQGTVTLSGTITPGGVTVSTGAYTFAGSAIRGDGGLTVSGGTLTLKNAANTYSGNTVVGAGATLTVSRSNLLPHGAGKGGVSVDGTLVLGASGTSAHTLNGLSGSGEVRLSANTWDSGSMTLGGGDASDVFDGRLNVTAYSLSLFKTGTGTIVLNGGVVNPGKTTVNGGTLVLGGLNALNLNGATTVNDGGTLVLGGSNTLSGATTVNGGMLRLGGTNSAAGTIMVNAGTLEIADKGTLDGGRTVIDGGATLDVSERNAALEIGTGTTLAFRGLGATVALATAAGKGVTLAGAAALHFDAYDGATPAVTVAGGGSLTVSSENTVTVTVAGDTPLAVGDYTLVSGGVTGTAPATYVTVNGAGRAAATTAALLIDGGDLVLRIADYVPGHGPMSLATAAAGPWDDPATWQGGVVPGPGDRVTVNHAVTLAVGTHPLASFSNNATLTFNGWNAPLVADNATINATVTHLAQSATAPDPVSGEWVPGNRVLITGGSLTVAAGGKINADKAGYRAQCGPAWDGASKNIHNNSSCYFGGSYGGLQSYPPDSSHPCAPHSYGSVAAPLDPGSGGGKTPVGGGAVRIDLTGGLIVNGDITANGHGSGYWNGGASSGGGIYITCHSVSGTGNVTANGGSQGAIGGGGGGRVAVHYNAEAQSSAVCSVRFEARGGLSVNTMNHPGGPGSLYFTDNQLFTSPAYLADGWKFAGVLYSGAGLTSLAVNGPVLLDRAWIVFPEPGFTLNVTGDLTITGLYTHVYGLFLATNGHVGVSGNLSLQCARLQLNGGSLNTGGDFTQTGSDFRVYAAPTNAPGRHGATVDIGGTWLIRTNAVCYPCCDPTNGAIVSFQTRDLTVDAGGQINADGAGWAAFHGPGRSGFFTGASHGGTGGVASATYIKNVKPPYGSETEPLDPGSGSGGNQDAAVLCGGGVVLIRASRFITLNGSVTAKGLPVVPGHYWNRGSSGGSVCLSARRFLGGGTGTVSVQGGAESACMYGAGGGGRIAVWCIGRQLAEGFTATAAGGAQASGSTSIPATDGTVFWGQLNAPGTVLLLQ